MNKSNTSLRWYTARPAFVEAAVLIGGWAAVVVVGWVKLGGAA